MTGQRRWELYSEQFHNRCETSYDNPKTPQGRSAVATDIQFVACSTRFPGPLFGLIVSTDSCAPLTGVVVPSDNNSQ